LGRLYQAIGKSAAAEEELQKVRELHATQDSLLGKMPSSSNALNSTETKQ
jgi:hypothetical protein